ncbi:MAG: putative ABC transporter permease [Bacilli bacterium]|nr:putative ABC transporter permease [Bacilli bacterium]
MNKKIRNLFIYFFVYAVIGWIYELFIFYYHGEGWINRGFLYGPYLPVYGFGMLLLIAALKNIMNKKFKMGKIINVLLVLIGVFIIATLTEYIAHYILDTYFNIKLWDYSKQFLNINGRVCFNASRNFAIGGTFLLYCINPIVDKFIKKTKEKKLNTITIVLFAIVIIDLIITILTKYI